MEKANTGNANAENINMKEINTENINAKKQQINILDMKNINGENAQMSEKEDCPCCEKTTERSEEERKKLIARLNRIEGQIRGIKGMIEKDSYCTDILVQSAAVNAAINAFNKELLGRHIHTCVVKDIRDGKEEVVDELMETLQRLMR